MARLRAHGFDGVQVTSGGPPSPGVMPFCGLDRINSPQESLPIATKYADTAKVQVTRTVKRLHGRVTRSILILPSVMEGRLSGTIFHSGSEALFSCCCHVFQLVRQLGTYGKESHPRHTEEMRGLKSEGDLTAGTSCGEAGPECAGRSSGAIETSRTPFSLASEWEYRGRRLSKS